MPLGDLSEPNPNSRDFPLTIYGPFGEEKGCAANGVIKHFRAAARH
jgi:hypothetical protein